MSISNEDLQRYFDGELDEPERQRVEAGLTDEDRERLAAMAEMRSLVRGALTAEAESIDLWPAVGAALPGATSASAKKQAMRSWRDRVRVRRLAGTGAGLLVAAAAALLLVFRPWSPPRSGGNNVEIQSLELDGLTATVLTVDARRGSDSTTILFTTEED
jgi:anti-sigma factor RsiW